MRPDAQIPSADLGNLQKIENTSCAVQCTVHQTARHPRSADSPLRTRNVNYATEGCSNLRPPLRDGKICRDPGQFPRIHFPDDGFNVRPDLHGYAPVALVERDAGRQSKPGSRLRLSHSCEF
jgi:hypothetical protein